jgi:PleD family two-component response regulator
MNSMENSNTADRRGLRTVLIIDNGPRERRKERMNALKDAGFKVHPARSFEQSLSRVASGSYDLVVANTDAAVDAAKQFCSDIKKNYPRQKLLVLKPSDLEMPGEFEVSSSDGKSVAKRAQELFPATEQFSEPVAA